MIYRAKHKGGFTLIDNNVIRETNMSSSAFRLLLYMLSCADDWEFSLKGLAYALGWSERKTRDVVAELKKLGHIVQRTQKGEHGHFLPSAWDVYEVPVTAEHKNGEPVKTSTRRADVSTVNPFHGHAVPRVSGKNVNYKNNNTKRITNIKEDHREKKKEKLALGEYQKVLLSNEDQEELCNRFGFETVVKYIDRLDEYLFEHPEKDYKNHKATITKWIKEDERRLAT